MYGVYVVIWAITAISSIFPTSLDIAGNICRN